MDFPGLADRPTPRNPSNSMPLERGRGGRMFRLPPQSQPCPAARAARWCLSPSGMPAAARRVKVAPGVSRFSLGLRKGFTGNPATCRMISGRQGNWLATQFLKRSQGIPGGGSVTPCPDRGRAFISSHACTNGAAQKAGCAHLFAPDARHRRSACCCRSVHRRAADTR